MVNPDTVQLPEPRTLLYPLIQQRVAETARPIAERLEAWRMMNSRASLKTTYFNGKPVSYQGVVAFDGAPRVVFWGEFFEPFMFDAARQSLQWVIQVCHDRHLDASEYLSEAMALLNLLVAKTYEAMARTDQILRGRGYPDSVSPVQVAPQGRGDEEEDCGSRGGLDSSRPCGAVGAGGPRRRNAQELEPCSGEAIDGKRPMGASGGEAGKEGSGSATRPSPTSCRSSSSAPCHRRRGPRGCPRATWP